MAKRSASSQIVLESIHPLRINVSILTSNVSTLQIHAKTLQNAILGEFYHDNMTNAQMHELIGSQKDVLDQLEAHLVQVECNTAQSFQAIKSPPWPRPRRLLRPSGKVTSLLSEPW